jgi:cobalamin synthase
MHKRRPAPCWSVVFTVSVLILETTRFMVVIIGVSVVVGNASALHVDGVCDLRDARDEVCTR